MRKMTRAQEAVYLQTLLNSRVPPASTAVTSILNSAKFFRDRRIYVLASISGDFAVLRLLEPVEGDVVKVGEDDDPIKTFKHAGCTTEYAFLYDRSVKPSALFLLSELSLFKSRQRAVLRHSTIYTLPLDGFI